jgi:signal transduction histidine kinase
MRHRQPLAAKRSGANFLQRGNGRWAHLLEWSRQNPFRADAWMAAGIAFVLLLSIWYTTTPSLVPGELFKQRLWSVPLAFTGVVSIAWRRRFPIVQGVLCSGMCVGALIGELADSVGLMLSVVWMSIYSMSAYGGRHRKVALALLCTSIFAVFMYYSLEEGAATATVDQSQISEGTAERSISDRNAMGTNISIVSTGFASALGLALLGSAVLFGDTMRIRRRQADDLVVRAIELEAERDRNADRAVTEERLRIARELHDVMAHHVTVIGVQAVAADRTMDRDPAVARAALSTITSSSREIVEELQRLLGFLRSNNGAESDTPAPPQPTVADISRLVADSVALGGKVSLHTAGPLQSLPGSVSLSAYRIVQEALTNVRKHAPASVTTVSVNVGALNVTVRVESVGEILRSAAGGTGHGLIGMRERSRLVGGSLRAGPTQNGWIVEAELPRQPGKIL